jgi:hypothetical protein
MKSNKIPQSKLPNFIIIGAGKSGTTSLHYYLQQHPNIYMSPIKETNFFAYAANSNDQFLSFNDSIFPVKDIATYKKLFNGAKNEAARGECSPMYLWHPIAPKNIKSYIPEAKLICVLRNPVERSYSAYLMYVSQNFERRTFSQAVADEIKFSKTGNWLLGRGVYIGIGFYHEQLKRYLQYFHRNQIKVILYDDYRQNSLAILNSIYRFLEINMNIFPKILVKHNPSGLPKNKTMHHLLQPRKFTKQIRRYMPRYLHDPIFNFFFKIKSNNLVKPPLNENLRRKIVEIFREDILKLQHLIKRDLTHWLN